MAGEVAAVTGAVDFGVVLRMRGFEGSDCYLVASLRSGSIVLMCGFMEEIPSAILACPSSTILPLLLMCMEENNL